MHRNASCLSNSRSFCLLIMFRIQRRALKTLTYLFFFLWLILISETVSET